MKYHNITKEDMLNGDGLRVVLWVSGCEHGCIGCQNPITWDPEDGLAFDAAAEKELFHELDKDYISGITLTGGDPLFPGNRKDIENLTVRIKAAYPDKTIWLYTGYLWEEINMLPWMQDVDVIVEGRFVIEELDNTLHWKGSKNQRVIDVKQSLHTGTVVLYD